MKGARYLVTTNEGARGTKAGSMLCLIRLEATWAMRESTNGTSRASYEQPSGETIEGY